MAIIISLWLIFFVSHSVLAATPVKSFFEKNLKMTPPQYRLLFNGVSLFIMVFILLQLIKTSENTLFERTSFIFGVGCAVIVTGLWLLKLAFRDINLSVFLGISAAPESFGLVTTGMYAVVRHPLYLGLTVALLGLFLIVPTIQIAVSVAFCILYIIIGIEFEERKLRQIFGAAYDDFAKGKKKFIPFIY